jgi:hypothetical protein
VATEAIGGRYTRRIQLLAWLGVLLAVLFIGCNAVVTLPLALASAFGTYDVAEVTGWSTYITKSKGGRIHTHYVLEARTSDGLTISSEVPPCTYDVAARIAREQGRATAPVLRVGRGQFGSYIGTVPWASVAWVWLGALVGASLAVFMVREYRSELRWYDRAVLDERGAAGRVARAAGPVARPR